MSDYQFVDERSSVWACKKRKKQHADCKKFRVVRFSFIVNDCSIPRTISKFFHLHNSLWSYCCAATTVSRTMHLLCFTNVCRGIVAHVSLVMCHRNLSRFCCRCRDTILVFVAQDTYRVPGCMFQSTWFGNGVDGGGWGGVVGWLRVIENQSELV